MGKLKLNPLTGKLDFAFDVDAPQCNFVAVVDPVTTDDSTEGYAPGSRWLNTATQTFFVCVGASTGAAVWLQTVPSQVTRSLQIDAVPPSVLTVLDTVTARTVQWLVSVSDDISGVTASTTLVATVVGTGNVEFSEYGTLGVSSVPFLLSLTESGGVLTLKMFSGHSDPVDVRITRTITKE